MTDWVEKPNNPKIYEPGIPDVRLCTCYWCDPDTTKPIMTCQVTGRPAPMLPDPLHQPEPPAKIKPHRMVEISYYARPPSKVVAKIRSAPHGLLIAITLSALAIAAWALITIGVHQ